MSKNNEVEIYEDKLPTDKEEMQKELLKYKKKEKKNKEKRKNRIEILLLLILIGIIAVAILFQFQGQQDRLRESENLTEAPLEQYQYEESNYYNEQYRSASQRYGDSPIQIHKKTTRNGITTNVKQIVFLENKTIIAVEVVNHNDQPVHLMLPQQSYLRDNTGRRYEIDPFESDSNLNSTLPGMSKDYTNLVFEKVNENATSLTYSADIGGLMGTPAWNQKVTFELE